MVVPASNLKDSLSSSETQASSSSVGAGTSTISLAPLPPSSGNAEDVAPSPEDLAWDVQEIISERLSRSELSTNFDSLRVSQNEFYLALFGVLNLVLFELVSRASYFSEIRTQLRTVSWSVASVLSLVLLVLVGRSLARRAWRNLRAKVLSTEVCLALAVLVSAWQLLHSLIFNFQELLTQPLLCSLLVLLLIVSLDSLISQSFLSRLKAAIGLPLVPSTEHVRRLDANAEHLIETPVSATALKPGDRVRLAVGEVVPCDSTIEHGSCEVAEQKYSAHRELRLKTIGHKLFSGSVLTMGGVTAKIESTTEDSIAAYFAAVLNRRIGEDREATTSNSLLGTIINAALIFIAACAALYWRELGASPSLICYITSAVLLAAMLPRTLQLAPLLKAIGLTSAFRFGAGVRSSAVLSDLAKTKEILVDFNSNHRPGTSRASDFEMIDERVDQQGLLSVLLALFGGIEEEPFDAVAPYLRTRVDQPRLHEVREYNVYPGQGVSGNVEGSEVTAGTEGFLIARGVHCQPSELGVSERGEQYLYVAVEDEVVARFKLHPPFTADAKEFLRETEQLGLAVLLCSTEDATIIDKEGKRAGIELSSIFGGMTLAAYRERVRAGDRSVLLASSATAPEILADAKLAISPFDDVRWEVDASPVVLFDHSLNRLGELFGLARTTAQVLALNLWFSVGLSVVLIGLAFIGLVAPGIVAISALLGVCFVFLNALRLIPSQNQ